MLSIHQKLGKLVILFYLLSNKLKSRDSNFEKNHIFDHFSCEVAQFINLSVQECRSILDRYNEEQAREVQKIKEKYV